MIVDFDLREFTTLDSTQKYAISLQDVTHGTIISTKMQSSGFGTRGREWSSADGDIALTVVLKKSSRITDTYLPFIFASAACKALEKFINKEFIGLKWVNDIMLKERKLSGILCQSYNNWLYCGIGINIHPVSQSDRISILDIIECDPVSIKSHIIERFSLALKEYYNHVYEHDFSMIKSLWTNNALYIGRTVRIDSETGVFRGISENGEAILDNGGIFTVVKSGTMRLI